MRKIADGGVRTEKRLASERLASGGERLQGEAEVPGPTEPPPGPADAPTAVSRRAAVAALGLVPLGAAIDWQDALEKFTRVPRPQRLVARRQTPDAPYAPAFFTEHEYDTVRVLVDYIIPRDERSGSATDAKVPEWMDAFLADEGVTSPPRRIAIRGGLAWVDRECHRRWGKPFVQCGDAERRALLDDIAWPKKARPEVSQGVAFFNSFRDLTASGFWSSETGVQDLRYVGNEYVPEWTGCPPEALRRR